MIANRRTSRRVRKHMRPAGVNRTGYYPSSVKKGCPIAFLLFLGTIAAGTAGLVVAGHAAMGVW